MTKKEIDMMRPMDIYGDILKQREVDGEKFFQSYQNRLVEVACPACGGESAFAFKKYGFKHQLCGECRTMFCSPRPQDDLLTIFYNEFEAPRLWTELLLKTDTERNAFQYKPRVENIIGAMNKYGGKRGGTALDIGAGSGAFSQALKNTGYFSEVTAMDMSKDCVEVCRKNGLNSLLGTITLADTASFDFICMNDLFEHLFDPLAFLRECFRVLRPDGFLSLATPNGEGFDFKILKDQTRNITPPEHLNYFNPASTLIIMDRAGFETVSIETPGILDVDIIAREKIAGFPLIEKNEYLDYLMEQDKNVLNAFQNFLADNRLSSHMLALARRPASSPE